MKIELKVFENQNVYIKYSIINFHIAVGLSDGQINRNEEVMLEKMLEFAEVNINDCIYYFEHNGKNVQLTEDLKKLDINELQNLVMSIWYFIICDSNPKESELSVAFSVLKQLGIDDDKFFEIIENN